MGELVFACPPPTPEQIERERTQRNDIAARRAASLVKYDKDIVAIDEDLVEQQERIERLQFKRDHLARKRESLRQLMEFAGGGHQ